MPAGTSATMAAVRVRCGRPFVGTTRMESTSALSISVSVPSRASLIPVSVISSSWPLIDFEASVFRQTRTLARKWPCESVVRASSQRSRTITCSAWAGPRRIPKSELIVKVRDWAGNSVPEPAQVRWPWSRNRVAGMLSGCWPAPEATPHGARAQHSRPRSPRGCWVPHPARDVPPALVRIRAGCCG